MTELLKKEVKFH
jgi:hypothetical protein